MFMIRFWPLRAVVSHAGRTGAWGGGRGGNLHDGQADEADISAGTIVSIFLRLQQRGASFQSPANVDVR